MRSRSACSVGRVTGVNRATIVVLSSLCLLACRAAEPEPSGPPAAAPRPEAGVPAAASPRPVPSSDPEIPDKLADLDAMCQALNRDYGDGTLGDYYAGLTPRTSWGKQQIASGNESMQPGRLLERAVVELAPGSEALTHCRKLLEYLDEVE
jgi:hypothetical protein